MQAGLTTLARSVVLLLVLATAVFAQGTGEITGTVTDATGGIVPGASVTVTNTATGAARHGVSNDAGVYSVPALSPGSYTVVVELQGFRTQTRRDMVLQVQQVARADFTLEAGAVSESIEVTGGAALLAHRGQHRRPGDRQQAHRRAPAQRSKLPPARRAHSGRQHQRLALGRRDRLPGRASLAAADHRSTASAASSTTTRSTASRTRIPTSTPTSCCPRSTRCRSSRCRAPPIRRSTASA